jgi:putative transposase
MQTMTRKEHKAERIDLKALAGGDRDFLRELIRTTVQEVLEAEMTDALGAAKSERTAARNGYRSGYYGRSLITRVGKLELRVPQDRAGQFSTELFERYQRSERALVAALAEMYVQGVSTRKVKAITEELCGHSFSASSISTINKRLDQSLAQFAARPLSEVFPLYLQHSNDFSESGRDRPSFPEVFKTVSSAWSSRPDKKAQGPNSRQG